MYNLSCIRPASQAQTKHNRVVRTRYIVFCCAQVLSPERFRRYTVCGRTSRHFGINFLNLAHRGDLGPLHTLRTKDSPRSIARHWFTHAAKRQGSPHNLWPTRLLSEPPFFTRAAQLQAESARLARAACGTNGGRRLCSGPTRPGQSA